MPMICSGLSDRPYRSAWSAEKAMSYIIGQAGKHFDPEVVECFCQFFSEHIFQ